MRRRLQLGALTFVLAAAVVGNRRRHDAGDVREGGIFRVALFRTRLRRPGALVLRSAAGRCSTPRARGSWPIRTSRAPEGSPPRPEVAADFPKISRNGKTYTFELRSGFRFSDGTPGAGKRVRTRDQPHARAGSGLAGRAVHQGHRGRRGRPGRQGDRRRGGRRAGKHARDPVHAPGRRLRREDDDAVLLRRSADAAIRPRGTSPSSRARVRTSSRSTGPARE